MLSVAVGCGASPPPRAPRSVTGADDAVARAVAAQNDLAWRVFDRLADDGSPNVVYSPFGAYLALALVEPGAAGATRDEALRFLMPASESEEDLLLAMNALLHRWLAPRDRALDVSARVLVDRRLELLPAYRDVLRERFATEPQSLDLRSSDEVRRALGPMGAGLSVGPRASLLVVSEVAFRGRWANPFEVERTRLEAFHAAGGQELRVPTMVQSDLLSYSAVDGAQVVSLPYAGSFSLVLIRPEVDSPGAPWSAERFDAALAAGERREVEIHLPRFVGSSVHRLSEPLRAEGLERPFDLQQAELPRLARGTEPLALGAVLQAARIEVDEEGTRAEATTVARVVPAAASLHPLVLRFDHPFVFVVRDDRTGAVVFLGRVGDPSPGVDES